MPKRRPWLEQDDVEAVAESNLRRANLWPKGDSVRIDIETFVEIYLGASVDYGVALVDGTLGYSVLSDPPKVVVDKKLTELAHANGAPLGLRGRWRATLAHEAAHLMFHRSLFEGRTPSQHGEREAAHGPEPAYDWREVQANMGMAALLMPRRLFLELAREVLSAREPLYLPLKVGSTAATSIVAELATAFEASHEATRRRLMLFGWLADEGE